MVTVRRGNLVERKSDGERFIFLLDFYSMESIAVVDIAQEKQTFLKYHEFRIPVDKKGEPLYSPFPLLSRWRNVGKRDKNMRISDAFDKSPEYAGLYKYRAERAKKEQ